MHGAACNRANPYTLCRYFADCARLIGEVPQHKVLDVRSGGGWQASAETRQLWASAYPNAPCDALPLTDPAATTRAMQASLHAVHSDWQARVEAAMRGTYDIAAAAARQAAFHYQVSLPHFSQPEFVQRSVARCVPRAKGSTAH